MRHVLESHQPHSRHPCFDAAAGRFYGRIHLPVAPRCNIRCGYCNRSCDCVNESRPGVTSAVLEPEEAASRLEKALREMPFISVAGIAGPGDPFCEPERTLRTLELIRRKHPDLELCLSSNGLNVRDFIPDLSGLGVHFTTVTVNAVSPDIGAQIYTDVRIGPDVLQGRDAAAALLERQMETIAGLKARHLAVKVNTVLIPGVNDRHVCAVAQCAAKLGADLMNLIGIIPLPGTALQDVIPPSASQLARLRRTAAAFLPQMHHCRRCRADAAGLLADDRSCRQFLSTRCSTASA